MNIDYMLMKKANWRASFSLPSKYMWVNDSSQHNLTLNPLNFLWFANVNFERSWNTEVSAFGVGVEVGGWGIPSRKWVNVLG